MTRCVVYSRFSSNNQREESIDAQLRASEEFASKKGYELVGHYSDKARSGTNSSKRSEFLRMIKDAEKGLFDVVIVHKLDRFSRDKYDSALYKRKLKQCGVRLVSVTEQLDDSPESVILESVIEGMAEYYSKNLARETMKGLKENAYQCKHTGGMPPLGYDVNSEKKYIINEREAESVRLIFEMYTTGYSQSKMVNELNERGFKTKLGTVFRANSIHSILTNEKYTGVYVYNKSAKKDAFGKRNSHAYKDESEIRIEGGMPQIISKETFEKAQEVLKARRRAPGTNKAKENYLLAGLIRCGCCGRHYQGNRRQGKNKPMYVSYRCSYRRLTSSKVCDNKEIRKEYIEEYVLSELERKIFNDKAIPHLVEGINKNIQKKNKVEEEKKEVIKKEIKEIEAQINKIVTAIASGFMQEEFKNKMDELKGRKSELEFKLSELKSDEITQLVNEKDVRNLLNNFSGYVISRNIPECKKFVQDFVKEVIVYKEHIEVIFNVSFSLFKNNHGVEVKSKINRYVLYERYSNSFYIKVS